MLCENEPVDRRNHDVLVAVRNKSALLDISQRCVSVAGWNRAPFPDRRQLGDSGVPGDRRVPIILAGTESFYVRLSRCDTDVAGSEEGSQQELHRISLLLRRKLRKRHPLAAAWSSPQQYDAFDKLRMVKCQLLRNHSAEREAYKVNRLQPQSAAKGKAMLGHLWNIRRRLTPGTCNTCVVKKNHLVISGKAVGHHGIPTVHV